MAKEKCILCGSTKDIDSDHIRTAYLNKNGTLESGFYRPQIGIDEKYIIKSHIGDGRFEICSNRAKCRQRQGF